MADRELKAVRWLKNGGLTIERRRTDGTIDKRFVRPGAAVTISEAAKALGCYDIKLYRMRDRGTLAIVKRNGATLVPVTELHRVRREWRRLKRKTTEIKVA